MPADAGLIEWAKESLEPLGTITHRAMMGAAVLYCDGTVFAVVDDEAIYFKFDAVSAPIWDEPASRTSPSPTAPARPSR
jgi:DNA transformation protein